ncbi:MAG: TldD/PmbA family protein [Bacillota bacterium]|uniref:TldD/PmbA family protein n=1 Tax=Desulfurispora thermophila TaxID=265470 RepID=UPI00036ADD3B|nr:TldD/PmbA family protein [Desulfurispora thermophila]
MLDRQLLKEVLDLALAAGGDFADIFVENKAVTSISCEDGRIERVITGVECGAGVRVLSGDATSYAFTNDLSRDSLLEVARIASHAAQGDRLEACFDLRRQETKNFFTVIKRPDQVATAQKVEVVQAADRAARQVDREKIKQVQVGYGDVVQQVVMANSEGDYVADERIRTRLIVQAVAMEQGVLQTGYEALGNVKGFELVEGDVAEALARTAAERAVKMLSAQPAPAGRMPVVMAGEAGGTMVHEACGHGLEADLVQKGLSVYAGKVGQKVAATGVTVVDDATLDVHYGSYAYDDEAVPAEKVVLIKDGVLQDFLYDRLTARQEKRRSNGHGRRESYQYKPIPRMANTYIAPGKEDPEKIIREAKQGLLVKKMGGGQVNTTTGDFVFDVAEGYLIVDGQVGPLVRGATLTGNGPEVLQQVEMVGADLGFTIGTCGKDGQGVPVSDAQPTIFIKQLVVGGTASGQANGEIRRL